jgi:hypothetical protein
MSVVIRAVRTSRKPDRDSAPTTARDASRTCAASAKSMSMLTSGIRALGGGSGVADREEEAEEEAEEEEEVLVLEESAAPCDWRSLSKVSAKAPPVAHARARRRGAEALRVVMLCLMKRVGVCKLVQLYLRTTVQ